MYRDMGDYQSAYRHLKAYSDLDKRLSSANKLYIVEKENPKALQSQEKMKNSLETKYSPHLYLVLSLFLSLSDRKSVV